MSSGKITERERDQALDKVTFTTDLADMADRQLVMEAVIEDDTVKASIFAELDRVITDPDAVLASNTSSIPIMKIAAATENPQRVLGLHFFNPVPVLPLVELVSTLVTSEQAAARTEQFASDVLGKQVVRCSDRSGFVVNALLVPYLLAAIRMVEGGFATIEDVDKAVVAGLSHPMGPLRLSDLVGLDTLKLIADKMFDEFKEPLYSAPPLLLRMVEAGRLGKRPVRASTATDPEEPPTPRSYRPGGATDPEELPTRRGLGMSDIGGTIGDGCGWALNFSSDPPISTMPTIALQLSIVR